MCWSTYYGMLSVRHTATKDIPVKKAFLATKSEIRSLIFSGFRWTKGILRKAYLGKVRRFRIEYTSPRYIWSIEEGFHSAKDIKIDGYYTCHPRLKVSNGKKAGRIFTIRCESGIEILNCIIPKGSKYYVNECGEYVSDQLIVLPNQ